ncbi:MULTISPECIES: stage V sporulation protein AA [Paenibacillus]|uniref:Stage V sporulation protein AA n=1 Tax=Paenibacillus azoreducens TaxID=116718 RepID=A0A919YBZ7_9BACL|nr:MULTISPECIES: stage V sporulation protein AA [Paenibacillus]MBE9912957.1 stage V sporulation protein AA [Paenibacillus donghaensis]GIO47639.1 stage V sporulation protein AA [Paenibacillus azoreducens]
MSLNSAPTVYLQLRSRVPITEGRTVTLGHVARILCDPKWEAPLRNLELARPQTWDGNLLLIDLMHIIPLVQKLIPGVIIEPIGQTHVLVEVVKASKKPSLLLFLLVWVLLFFGSALTIMNFHADVNMQEVQIRTVEMLTGRRDEHPYLFQAAYSFGIGFGMVIFFNHLFKKKWNEEPTPLEVEMYLYQENIDQFVVAEEYKRMRMSQNQGDKP